MSAKNPFRVSDLIAKYGWKIMPYLSNLGPQLLAEAQVLFVDSGHTNALDVDDTEHGHSFEKPLATIDYAIGLCTAEEGSIIFAAPGHNEQLGDTQVDFDVSDIICIGIGVGTNKPRIDFDHANSSVNIGANNVHILGIILMPSITDVLIGIDVETGVTGTVIDGCNFAEGEDAADEFILGIDVKAGCTNTKVVNCLGRTKVASAGAVAAVKFTGASDNCIVEKCRFIGNYSTAAIVNDTGACTDLLIDDLTCKVADGEPGIEVHTNCTGIIRNVCIESTGTTVDNMIVADSMSWFNNFGVTADGTAAEIIGGGEVQAALDTAITSPTGSSLRDILHKDGSHTYSKTTDSLEALSEAIALVSAPTDTTAAVPDTPTEKSLQDILSKLDGENSFDNTTDSLEAISDKITAITDNVSAAVPDTPTGNSLQDILSKLDGANTYDNTTDSLEAISDKITDVTTDIASAVPDTPVGGSLQDILSKLDGANTYDNTTDSLEAIADALAAGTGATTALEADLLHFVVSAADGGSNAYPDSVVSDSVLAYLMSKGDPAAINSFNNTTDSLEAISDFVRTGTTLGEGINLDHLMLTSTGVAADGELDTHITALSVLGHIMATDADPSSYNASSDSLMAIGTDTDAIIIDIATAQTELDKIGGIVNAGGTATIGGVFGDFANSSLVTRLGLIQTDVDSIGTISNAGGTAELGAALGPFANVTLVARLDSIDTVVDMGRQTVKAASVDLKTGDKNVFTVATGPVKITSLFVIMDEATDAACKLGFSCTPTAGSETDLTLTDGSGVELNAQADAGDIVYSELDGTVMVIANTDGGEVPTVPEYSQVVPIGAINVVLENSAPSTGIADVYVQWEPLAPGATLTTT